VSQGIQYAVDSIAFGSLFALMALALALLFGVMGLMNFAYGELIMAGAFTMYYTRGAGWGAMIGMTILVVTVLSLLMELIAFRPVRRASPVTLLVTSFAVSYGLQQLGWMTVGKGPQKGVEPYPFLTKQLDVSGVLVSRLTIITVIVTIVLLVGMTLLLKRTTLGIQLRASTEDFRMAQLVGVKANWVISAAFGITGLLASAVAILYVLRTGAVDPEIGRGPLLVAFVGGETAELPGIYREGELDFAGTCVGVVERETVLDGSRVLDGDFVVGFPSSGVHANGFTLARRVLEAEDYDGDDLLAPTRCYLTEARRLRGDAHAFAHVTGGGIEGNLARVVPEGLEARIDWESWERPTVFGWLARHVAEEELRRVFNLGIGYCAVLPEPGDGLVIGRIERA